MLVMNVEARAVLEWDVVVVEVVVRWNTRTLDLDKLEVLVNPNVVVIVSFDVSEPNEFHYVSSDRDGMSLNGA
tara:strand:+ start:1562 stop:1780 length:219 start_codon:yes stop_codon:yes gene_type:complete